MATKVEEQHALDETAHCVNVTNLAWAVLRARQFDEVRCAMGVASMGVFIAGESQIAKTALAKYLVELAKDLDSDVVLAARVH